ncbi:hypothetical protein B0A54_04905 [Friedmanniomyces endolithicus]|uniref:Helicase ATP-binding domain-containing protein n=1 Tax=Friedmanniomyces endolithicus TaxID=329885 RepID=A0A4V5N8M2_9PEZI|nr:hypothetical protein LTS09_000364 [Friedmanniomyces endolithicus]TKA44139.1 hypothetical protein B0A54_04905 [Friedmanniomyces endolithicus]
MDAALSRLAQVERRLKLVAPDAGQHLDVAAVLTSISVLETAIEGLERSNDARNQAGAAILPSQRIDVADDEFDMDSSDEADLLRPTTSPVLGSGVKRKSEEPNTLPAKRLRSEGSPLAISIANKVLKDRFGMGAFRLKQQAAIARLLDGESCVVVFPTGGGKSLCYQVPALCFREMDRHAGIRQGDAETGITLVVSPLITLMKDQVDALKRRGISAAVLDSTKSKEEYMETVE